ncbi:MAG TPA: ABC transporter transmembrane domain-containing protein, partial [Microbacteriaceae bacterium]|nr:ABC transporter transmembrane domain-containing protein [Microbacteriaceae bacterium]
MKPFDARLLRYARGILPLLSWGTFLALARAVAILIWAWSIAHLIAWVARPLMIFDWSVTFQGQVFEGLEDHVKLWVGLAITAVVVRSGATWLMSVAAERGAARIKDELRNSALKHIEQLGPEWIAKESEAKVTLRLSRGLDALDAYFSQYVPQLLLTITVTPLLTIALIWADLLSAIIVIIVFPVIPVFMILIGLATKSAQEKQWRALTQLSNTYLDVVRGLRTLKLFRREIRQVERVAKVTEAYRSRTMQVLRVTFLSGFVLDLAGTFSVALVAVTVGTRLVEGAFPLALALFVLLLVPEVFIPIRQVGAAFHASSEGLAAAEDVFSILETTPERPVQLSTHADLAHFDLEHTLQDGSLIKLKNVQVSRSDAPLAEPLTLGVMPGEIVAIAGPSGVGKTTILSAILGFVKYSGEISVTEYAWSGQRAGLLRG